MSFKEIPIPTKMQHLPLDKRGFPIPYIVLVDDNGTPHFKINDDRKMQIVIRWKWCAICGKPMRDDMWLVGGPMSAFHPNGAYVDTPVHEDCGHYALQVCPYLASKGYNTYAPIDKLKNVKAENIGIYVDPTLNPNRPKLFVFQKITGFKKHTVMMGIRHIVPEKPYLDIRFYDKGQRLTDLEALALIFEHNPEVAVIAESMIVNLHKTKETV